jgi:hypothetical protein
LHFPEKGNTVAIGSRMSASHTKVGFRSTAMRLFEDVARLAWVCLLLLAGVQRTFAADFTVIYPGGSAYTINGMTPNPTLTLFRGETYTFFINNVPSVHPFQIVSPPGTTTSNNIVNGTITFRVPTNAANYSYRCSIHFFGGQILTIPPPTIRIVKMNVSSNIVLRSTGTNNWRLMPEFSTNVGTTNWFAMSVQTNRFSNGTNETICGRPAGSNVFIRIKALRN